MSDIVNVNPQVLNSIQAVQQASLTGTVITHSGAGKAYQSVAQSAAIAIQDATDQMRNFGIISTTAAGVAVAQMLATGDPEKFKPTLEAITSMLTETSANFLTVGTNAATVLNNFPDGSS